MTYSLAVSDYSWITKANTDGSFTTFEAVETNADYQAYLAWVAEGNTPDPAPAPSAPVEPTAEEKLKASGLTVDELKSLLGLQ